VTETSNLKVEGPAGCTVVKRQTSYLRQRWSWTEETIWTENMLTALETGLKKEIAFFADRELFSMEQARVSELARRSR
jgi:hypothetical protein